MDCIIPGANLKILGKAIHALAKIGDEIYLEANSDSLSLRSVNMSTTVFAVIKFLNPFFTHYKLNEPETQSGRSTSGALGCKMPTKALLSAFKAPNQMERQVEICKMIIADNNPTKLTLKFRYKTDVIKTQNIWLMNGDEFLEVALLNDLVSNQITATSALYTQALSNFQLADPEVTLDVTTMKIILRNYVEGEIQRTNQIRSQLSLSSSEFSAYKVKKPTTITFSLKPLRAAIQFAENFNLGITLIFQECGKPIQFNITNSITFEANFILATMNPDGASESTISTAYSATAAAVPIKELKIINLSQHDKSALDTENWDDEMLPEAGVAPDVDEVIPNSPESPRAVRMKQLFQRCFEPTFHGGVYDTGDEILAENSDPECETLFS